MFCRYSDPTIAPYNRLIFSLTPLQRRRLGFLVVVVIMWNIFVLERILAFELTLIWSLWSNDISSLTYAIVISSITLTNIIHSMLIYESIKMHHGRLRFRRGEK